MDGKNFEANAQAIHALKSTLNDDYLSRVSNFDSAFVVWNTLTSLGEKDQYYAGSDSDVGSDVSNMCYMVQGDNPLEVTTESEVEEDVDMSYNELASFCQQLLEKYDMLRKDNKILKKNFDCMLKENDSLRTKVACMEKENEILKNENVSLLSKLNDLCEGNNTLKNKIDLVEKQRESVLQENNSLKRKFIEKEKEFVSKKNKKNDSLSHHALHATTTNEINVLKNKISNLSSTLSTCAFNHSKLESLFSKKQAPHVHAHHHHAYAYVAHHDHNHTHKHSKVYTCTHCGRRGHLAKFCYDRIHQLNFANHKNFWVPYKANPQGPKRKWVPKSPPLIFDVGKGSHTT